MGVEDQSKLLIKKDFNFNSYKIKKIYSRFIKIVLI